jgi:hypothetical protein
LVRVVLGYLAHGETTAPILGEFSEPAEEDVRAVIAFAAASAGEDLPAERSTPCSTSGWAVEATRTFGTPVNYPPSRYMLRS